MTCAVVWAAGAFLTAIFIGLVADTPETIDRLDTYVAVMVWPFFWTMLLTNIVKDQLK